MIVRLKLEDVKATGIRGEVDGKSANFYMLVEVSELDIQQAIEKCDAMKGVVGFLFTGEPSFLRTIELGTKPVIVRKEVEKLDMNTDFVMNELGNKIRVVLDLPKDYADMQAVFSFSQKYENLHFEGGKFLRLDGCRLGMITREDIPKKVADSRVPLVTEGLASVFPIIHIDDVDSIEYYDYKHTVKEKKTKAPSEKTKSASSSTKSKKPKKQLSSLLALTSINSFDNF